MTELNELISEQLFVIVAVIVVMMLILLISVLVQTVRLGKLRKRYERMMAGAGVEDLETLLLNLKVQTDAVEDEQEVQRRMLAMLEQRQRMAKSKLGMVRYNAFSDQGSDLSFSFALLDELDNGIVLSGLHNRDSSYVYAKPLQQGESKYALSPEEKEAVAQAQARREG
ncbi:DUF4446 family protein [Saccharibacillus sp. CPCC 101409]|uniref:DUF4446 family protein n=1 Tax=Saccharibacillus sp. CPCC 101409 TaxID=3058041 RepID=UPI0026725467|nr:DUF4446 family protein [Saccharibacillus sp. CPCC 101409]MDO3413232.1 DUF4446 family protein [Saccharibacillus sp. CPCC 101409]